MVRAMTDVEQVRDHVFPLVGMPIARFCRRIAEIAQRNGLEVEAFVERRGEASGMFVKLPSGRVLSLVEFRHMIEHHRERGPTVYIDAGEIAEFGVDFLVKEAVTSLRLSQQDIDWVAPPENRRIALDNVKHDGSRLPPPPWVGPADSYFHCVWIDADEDAPVEDYGELDADRWPMRWVKKYRDGRLEACSYASDNWRDKMPEGEVPSISEINRDPQFSAKDISKAEFESVWNEANQSKASSHSRQKPHD
jgi:hypothetical protein